MSIDLAFDLRQFPPNVRYSGGFWLSSRRTPRRPCEPEAIMARTLTFSVPLWFPTYPGSSTPIFPVQQVSLFLPHFFWPLLQANSCVRQLHGFCFRGSALKPLGSLP